jgi:hypothetical protein
MKSTAHKLEVPRAHLDTAAGARTVPVRSSQAKQGAP